MRLAILFFLVSATLSFGQLVPNLGGQRAGISALTFLKNEVSPKVEGMGGAQIASAGDAYSAHWNPAAMSDVKSLSFAVSNKLLPADMNLAYFSTIIPTKNKLSTFGVSSTLLNAGRMEKRTEFQPNGTGEFFYAYNLALGVSYSKILSTRFAFGASAKYVREQLAEFYGNTAVVDLGFSYKTNYKGLRFAVLVQNFGPNSSLKGTFPTFGFNKRNPSINTYPTPAIFKMGISLIPYNTEKYKLQTDIQLNHPNDNAENIALGLEFSAYNLLFLRAGYKINVTNQPYPTFGFGFNTKSARIPIKIEYGANPTSYQGIFHTLGIALFVQKPISRDQDAPKE